MAHKRIILSLSALVLTLGFLSRGTPTQAGHLTTNDFVTLEAEPTASIVQIAPSYKTTGMYVSKVYEAKTSFQLLGLNWQQALPKGTAANLEIRFRTTEGTWTEWQPVQKDEDGPDSDQSNLKEGYDQNLWSYVITPTSDAFEYRANLSTASTAVTPKLSNISFDYVNGGEASVVSKVSKLVFNSSTAVISRTQWGADENLRLSKTKTSTDSSDFEPELGDSATADDPDMTIVKQVNTDSNGTPLLWPQEYPAKIKKIIVHHTDTTGTIDNEESSIRAIYYYHAVTRGWGDIGYNYLVAPSGKIYEGRAGGEMVVAGHAKGYNTGSIGIALLGDYQSNPLPAPLMKSLEGLLYTKASLYNIDPAGFSKFRGSVIPNLLGHRDVGSTACPGVHTYDYLPGIREMVSLALNARSSSNTNTDYAYEESTTRELVTMNPAGSSSVTVKLKNTGTKTWDKNTFITVNANSEADSIISVPKDSQKRTAVMLESAVAPGASGTFTFKVSAEANGGLASFTMAPVFNGTKKTTHTMALGFYVASPTLDFSVTSSDAPTSLKPGESKTVTVKIKNTGNLTWKNAGDTAVTLIKSGTSSLAASETLASLQESEVAPGGTGTFAFTIKAPTTAGSYTLYFSPSMKNSNAVVTGSGQISVQVTETTEDALISSTSSDWNFTPGEKKSAWVQIKNTSSKSWSSSGTSAFKLLFNKTAGITIDSPKIGFKTLGIGASTKIYFTVTAPSTAGTYSITLNPRLGTAKLSNGSTLTMTVSGTAATTTISAESFTPVTYENPIRIKITPENGAGTPILTSTLSFAAYDGSTLVKVFSAGSRVRVSDSSGSFTLTSGSDKWTAKGPVHLIPENGGIMTIVTMSQVPAWNTSLNDNSFRGTITVADQSGTPILINTLPLDDYLKGIGEVSNSDHVEKIKTIITLARTYATHYTTGGNIKFAGMPYDLEDDPNTSQKYLGYGFELRSPNVTKAVQDTKGEVVTYNGKTIIAPYFSQSDGVATKNAKDVWGWTNTPWLVSVPDTACTSSTGTFSGHGVGLSGCGATTLAQQGKTFEEIIKTYYTGVDVQKL